MTSTKCDLFLGGDIGLWALAQVSIENIGNIFTYDSVIAEFAKKQGIKVLSVNANSVDYLNAEFGFSIHYPTIFRKAVIDRYKKMYNLHPSFLPWGRGYYPVFWALWEQTPAGATLHEINEHLDKGAIVDQVKVDSFPCDTGDTLFQRVRETEKLLFAKYWPMIVQGIEFPSTPQLEGGTYHSKKEFYEIKRLSKWESMTGADLIRLVKSLSFEGYSGLEITLGNKQFEVRLKQLIHSHEE